MDTASLGGAISGALAGATLGLGAGAGAAATTLEVAAVESSSNVIGGYAQRRLDETLGYAAPTDNYTELTNFALDATTGAVFGYAGGRVAESLFPIPNVQKEIRRLSFAHRRSMRPARISAAQRNAERQAVLNSAVGGVAGGVPAELSRWIWDLLTSQARPQQRKQKEIVTVRICTEEDQCTH